MMAYANQENRNGCKFYIYITVPASFQTPSATFCVAYPVSGWPFRCAHIRGHCRS